MDIGSILALLAMAIFGSLFTLVYQKISKIRTIAIPSFSESYKMVLIIRTDLNMSKGKVAAQCSHATLAAYKSCLNGSKSQLDWLKRWESDGQAKITLRVEGEADLYFTDLNNRLELQKKARSVGLVSQSILDAGRTQVATGTRTVLAIGPGPNDLIDSVTGKLKLY
jgi:PTH2 family peptidyl-tRNA hydrolase